MTAAPFPAIRIQVASAGAALLLLTASAPAQDASPWRQSPQASVRLVAGAPTGAPVLRAGIEIKLAPGWKTYWRYPGDSGIAPTFDFSASSNVSNVSVMWPAPLRFSDGAGTSIGYAERVLLPLRVTPARANAPALLRLKLDYAVCEKLCVPASARTELRLPADGTAHDAAVAASEARVPVRTALNAPGPLSIVAVRRTNAEPNGVTVDVRAPADAVVDLFAEGPSPDWSLPLPQPAPGAPAGSRRFAFVLDGLPPGAKTDGARLTLTAVSATSAIEVVVHLD